jgi:hypothetical protein
MPADPGAGLASLRLIRLRRLRFYRGGDAKAAGQHNDQTGATGSSSPTYAMARAPREQAPRSV